MIRTIKSLLTDDERVLYDARMHWMIFFRPVFYAIIGILLWIYFHPLVGIVILLMDLYPAYIAVVSFITTHLVVTNRKVIGRIGWLYRDWTQLKLERIETAFLEEPIIGRWLGFATVVVRGTGTGSVAFPYIVDGDEFIKKLEAVLNKTNLA